MSFPPNLNASMRLMFLTWPDLYAPSPAPEEKAPPHPPNNSTLPPALPKMGEGSRHNTGLCSKHPDLLAGICSVCFKVTGCGSLKNEVACSAQGSAVPGSGTFHAPHRL